MKSYGSMPTLLSRLLALSPNVVVLDRHNEAGDGVRRVVGLQDLRLTLAIAATADMFVGHDSGPLYAALGNLVPSVGLFATEEPNALFYPISEPEIRMLFAPLALSQVPVDDVTADCIAIAHEAGII
jgi:ADP-heptose:LPS heptosyltransferase